MVPDPHSPAPDWDQMVLVGRIARPHGLRGQVVVNPETDFVEERFAPGAVCWIRSGPTMEQLVVAVSRVHSGRAIVAFEGFARIEDVEQLAGLELRVPDAMLLPLQPGVYYEHQLAGCAVETVAGTPIGEVAKVEGGAGASRLVIDGPRGEIQIPLAVDICVEVDVENKRIRIDAPEGLLELNERRAAADRRVRTIRGRQPAG